MLSPFLLTEILQPCVPSVLIIMYFGKTYKMLSKCNLVLSPTCAYSHHTFFQECWSICIICKPPNSSPTSLLQIWNETPACPPIQTIIKKSIKTLTHLQTSSSVPPFNWWRKKLAFISFSHLLTLYGCVHVFLRHVLLLFLPISYRYTYIYIVNWPPHWTQS